MTDHKNETLSGTVELDGKVFEDVTFQDARLIYDGGVPPTFRNCQFAASNFMFREHAANTILFLRGMAPETSGMRGIVDGLIPELKG